MGKLVKIWISEKHRKLFLEDLSEDEVHLKEYVESYFDCSSGKDIQSGRAIQILEGTIDASWISKFRGIADGRGLFIHGKYDEKVIPNIGKKSKKVGHFVIGNKIVDSYEGVPTGTNVLIVNHPWFGPGELLYLTTSDATDAMYHLDIITLHERMWEEGRQPTAIELLGSDTDDIIERIFTTYYDTRFVLPGRYEKSPPLLLYEIQPGN